ncbi:MAG: ABC transporter ATP-binding protein [Candidatus Brockarchaeota archaeon]|nr:ABC transporter ATP-binding protein [Candidatus Brockarchaeota archaeon]
MNEIMHVRNLTKSYGKIKALDDVSFDMPEGVTALIGPNGSGKTTLINIILGLVKPDAGKITVLGFDPWRNGHLVRGLVSVLHEKPSFPKWFTGLEYLLYAADLYGVLNSRDRVYEVASWLNIASELNRRVGEYSAGMVQRLGLAQVLLNEPKLIILDEPTANLDPAGRIEVLNLIKALKKDKGISFILSSHVLPELARVCDFLVFLHYGRLLLASDMKSLLPVQPPIEYKIITNNNQLLFEMGVKAGLSMELHEDSVVLKNMDPDDLTKVLRLAENSGLTIRHVEPEESIIEAIYLSILREKENRRRTSIL